MIRTYVFSLLISALLLACSITDKTGYDIDLQYLLIHDNSSISAISPDNGTIFNYSNKTYTSIKNTIIVRNIKDNSVIYNIKIADGSSAEFLLSPAVDSKTGGILNSSCFKDDNITLPANLPLASKEFCLIDVTTKPTATTENGDISGVIIVDDNDGKVSEYNMRAKVLRGHNFDRVFNGNENLVDTVVFEDNYTPQDAPIGLLIDGELSDIKVAFSYLANTGIIIDSRTTCSLDFKTTELVTNGMPCFIFFTYQPKVDINQRHFFNINAKLNGNNINYSLKMVGNLNKDAEIYPLFSSRFKMISKQSFDPSSFIGITVDDVLNMLSTIIELKTISPKVIDGKVMAFASQLLLQQSYLDLASNVEETAFSIIPTIDLNKQCLPITTNRVLVRNYFNNDNGCSLSFAFTPLFMLADEYSTIAQPNIRKENINAHCFYITYSRAGIEVKHSCPTFRMLNESSYEPFLNYHNTFFFNNLFKTSAGSVMLLASIGLDRPISSPTPTNLGYDFLGYNFRDVHEDSINAEYPRKKYTIQPDNNRDRKLQLFFPQGSDGWRMLPYSIEEESCLTAGTGSDNISAITIDIPQGRSCSLFIESNGNFSLNVTKSMMEPFIIFDMTDFIPEEGSFIPLSGDEILALDNITAFRYFYIDEINNITPPCRKFDNSTNRLCTTKFNNTNVDAISGNSLVLVLKKDDTVARYKFDFSENFRRGFTIDSRTTCKGINYTRNDFELTDFEDRCYLIISFNPKEFNTTFNEMFKITYIAPDNSSRYDEFTLTGISEYIPN